MFFQYQNYLKSPKLCAPFIYPKRGTFLLPFHRHKTPFPVYPDSSKRCTMSNKELCFLIISLMLYQKNAFFFFFMERNFLCSLFINVLVFITTLTQIIPFRKALALLPAPWQDGIMHMYDTSQSVILGKTLLACLWEKVWLDDCSQGSRFILQLLASWSET